MFSSYIRTIILTLAMFFLVFEIEGKTENDKEFTVIIDPGHGGKDIGATENGVKEKDINLKVAKYLESLIKKKMKGTKVVMTRDDDRYLTLQERADKANKSHGDLFISIHTNSVDKRNKNRKNLAGSSVYTLGLHKDENNLEVAMRENSVIELEKDFEKKYSGFDPQRDESYIIFEMSQKKNLAQSIRFAETVENELVEAGRENRGIHQAGFWVLWATSMPSVLIELDFICNPNSAKYLISDKGGKELAEAIFKALQKYENSWQKSIKGDNKEDINNIYFERDGSNVDYAFSQPSEDIYVTKTRTRVHKDTKPQRKSLERKRRSASSRLLSLNNTYESDKLTYPSLTYNYLDGQNPLENEEVLAIVSDLEKEGTSKNEKKKNNKKKQKEEKQKKEDKKTKKRKEDAHNARVNKLVTVYKIQILASADLLSQGSSRFCGLSPITAYKENNLYKYYYGESTDKEELELVLKDVKKRIPDAFIVSSQKSIKTN